MRAAIYLRQSEDKTGEGLAIARQREQCEALAARGGHDVVGVYVDNDVSATSGKVRPSWRRLLSDLEAGSFDVLICWHTDRLYRGLQDLADLISTAQTHDLSIDAVRSGHLDLSTPSGRMLASMLASAARYEVEQKAVRQKEANRQRAKAGISIWSRRPYGFDRKGHDVFIVESEAEIIREMAAAVLAGRTIYGLVKDLNNRGVKNSLNRPWNHGGIVRVLSNPRIAGRITYNGEDYGKAPWEPIISQADYDRILTLLKDPRRRLVDDTRLKHAFSGLLRCGKCGNKMWVTPMGSKGNEYLVYVCSKSGCKITRKKERVDEVLEEIMVQRLSRPDLALVLAADTDVVALQEEADDLRHRRESLAELLADGLLPPEAVRAQAITINERLQALERRITGALEDSAIAQLIKAPDPVKAWQEAEPRQKRGIVDALMQVNIMPAGKGRSFTPDQVQITWRH